MPKVYNQHIIYLLNKKTSSTSPAPKQALHKPTFNASESHCWFSPIIYYMFLRSKYYSYSHYLHISKSLSMHIMHFCHYLALFFISVSIFSTNSSSPSVAVSCCP